MLGALLGGLGSQLSGGILGSLGTQFNKLLGGSGTGAGGGTMQDQIGYANQLMGMGIQNNRADVLSRMTNAAGQQGAQVGASHKMALDSLGQSANATRDANAMRSMGNLGLQNANTTANAALTQGQLGLGNMRKQMVEMGGQIGSPAAIAAMAGQLGAGAVGQGINALGQASQAYGQANQSAMQGRGQANSMLQGDLSNRNQIYVKPYEAQVSGGSLANSALGQLGGMSSSANQSAQLDYALNNPLAGLSAGLGDIGSFLTSDWQKTFLQPEDTNTNEGIVASAGKARIPWRNGLY